MNAWSILEIDITTNLSDIKKAYAKKIKKCKPEIDPQGFQLARQAYEVALKHAAGVVVNFEINDQATMDQQNQNSSSQPMESIIDKAFRLLNALQKSEEDAIKLFEELKQQGTFDNLDEAEQFQNTLAIHLLLFVPL
jgi:hypothetical protein